MLGRLNFATVADLGHPGVLQAPFAPARPGHERQPGGPELLRHGAAQEHPGRTGRFRPDQPPRGAPVARRGERAARANRSTSTISRRSIRPEHVMASGALPPGFPADPHRRGVLLRRGPRVQLAPHLHRGREAPDHRADPAGQPLQRARAVAPDPRRGDGAGQGHSVLQQAALHHPEGPRTAGDAWRRWGGCWPSCRQTSRPNRTRPSSPPLCDNRDWTIAHINNRRPAHGGQAKDAEFSRPAVTRRWAAGLEDVRISAANLEWMQPLNWCVKRDSSRTQTSANIGAVCGAQILALEPPGLTQGNRLPPVCERWSPTIRTDSLAVLLQCFFRAEPVFLVIRPDWAAPLLPKQIRQSGDALPVFSDNRFSTRRFDGNVFRFILLYLYF